MREIHNTTCWNIYQSLNSEVKILNSKVITLNSEVITLNSEVVTLNSEVITLNSEVVTLNSEVVTLNSEVITLHSEVGMALLNKGTFAAKWISEINFPISFLNFLLFSFEFCFSTFCFPFLDLRIYLR